MDLWLGTRYDPQSTCVIALDKRFRGEVQWTICTPTENYLLNGLMYANGAAIDGDPANGYRYFTLRVVATDDGPALTIAEETDLNFGQ